MSVTLNSRRDFTLRNLERVALRGETVRIGAKARRRMRETRESFMALLESDRTRFIYGTTSGGGHHASKPVAPEEQRAHASRAVWRIPGWGFGGEGVPERVVRGIVFARLANYVEGHAKSRPEVAERIASMLAGPMPRLPESGQVGAGEILPLFHVMSAIPQGDYEEGEPMAVINGSPVSAGLAADVALTSERRLAQATAVFALSIEALGAPLDAYDPTLARACADRHVTASLRRLSRLLRGASRRGRRTYQAPVSWRILPQVLGAAERAVETMRDVAETSLASITDNPVYLPPDADHPLGRVYSTGGYHNAQAYPSMDALNARYADLCTLCDHHTHRLHDPAVSGLPESLAMPGSGSPYGTGLLAFIGIGYAEEARHAAARTFLPASEGGAFAGQNDVPSPTMLAYGKHRSASRCLDSALAILSVAAGQALHVSARRPPPALAPLVETVRSHIPPIVEGVPADMSARLEALAAAFSEAAVNGAPWLPASPAPAR